MKYKRYSKYKDSGVEWIGEIPEGWEIKRLKFILDIPVSDGPHETPVFQDSGIPFFSVDNIQDDKLFLEKLRFITKEDHERFSLKCKPQKNDLLLAKAASVGKIALVDLDSEFNVWSPLAVIRVSQLEMLSKFCYFMFKSDFLQTQISLKINWNTQGNIGMKDIQNLQIITPSKIEQEQIINFLQKQTTQFDELIAKSKAQITLLEEKRQATITQAVTKGLDPSVKMKDSGVEWIGEIPEHWEVRKLNNLTQKIGDGIHSTPEYVDESDYFFVNGNNLIDGIIKFSDNTRNVSEDEHKKYKLNLNEKTILLSINGTIGNTALYNNEKIVLGKSACYIICNEKLNRKFLIYFLNSFIFKTYFELESTGTTIYNLSLESVKKTPITFPSYEEQEQIINFLKKQTTQFDELIAKSKAQITLLEEKRQALITTTVTGKIDVRSEVAA